MSNDNSADDVEMVGGDDSEDHESGDGEAPVGVTVGDELFTKEGKKVGTVRGIKDDGVFVTTLEGMEELSSEHVRSEADFGEAELMWRCTNCGEMGEIEDGLPDECPNCGIEKEELMYWTED